MTAPQRPTAEVWEIPRRVWFILASWGLAVLVLAGLFSFALWSLYRTQVEAMCNMMSVITSGPEPPAGPSGDRAREISRAMREYQDKIGCHGGTPPR